MDREIRELTKQLKALPHSGLLSSVDAEGANEVSSIAKGFPTFFALRGFFSSVGPFMQDEIRAVGEGFPTLAAHVRLQCEFAGAS